MRRLAWRCWASLLVAAAACAQAAPPAQAPPPKTDYAKLVASHLPKLAAAPARQRWQPTAYEQFEQACLPAGRPGAEAERKALCEAILPHLSARTPKRARLALVRILGDLGRAESVFELTRLRADEDGEVREAALRALQRSPSPEAAAALRRALDKAKTPAERVALIHALGYRRDAGAVETLGKLLDGSDGSAALAAAAALGKIGGDQAARVLNTARVLNVARAPTDANGPSDLRILVADSLLSCADRALADGRKSAAIAIYRSAYTHAKESKHIRKAAFRSLAAALGAQAVGLIAEVLRGDDPEMVTAAMEAAARVPGASATRTFAAVAANAAGPKKIALLGLLGARRDPAARSTVLESIKDPNEAVRVAGIKALAEVGTAEDVPTLAELTIREKGQNERASARRALQRLRGEGIDEAILSHLSSADPAVQRELVRVLGARGARQTAPALLKMLATAEQPLRLALLEALRQLAGAEALDPLLALVVQTKDKYELRAAEQAALHALSRAKDREAAATKVVAALKGAPVAARCALLRICGWASTYESLAALQTALSDADESVRDTALRALGEARDPRAADALFRAAKAAKDKDRQAVALRSYVRVVNQLQQPPEKKIWLYLRAMDIAQQVEEKKLILAGLGTLPSLAALTTVIEHTYTPELAEPAAGAAARIGYYIARSHPKEVAAAMQRVLKVAKDERTIQYARRALERAKPPARS